MQTQCSPIKSAMLIRIKEVERGIIGEKEKRTAVVHQKRRGKIREKQREGLDRGEKMMKFGLFSDEDEGDYGLMERDDHEA